MGWETGLISDIEKIGSICFISLGHWRSSPNGPWHRSLPFLDLKSLVTFMLCPVFMSQMSIEFCAGTDFFDRPKCRIG